jgi:oligopeptidase B
MLMGYIANKRPDLYKGIIAHVPFVDVLNTMLDATLPLTPGEYNEWGNPEESKRFFDYIRTYSPYDNVKNQIYPNMFVTTGVSDPRVGYFEAAKWVAKIRNRKTDDNLIIFKTNMDSGHKGSSGRFEYLKEIADDYVFLMNIFEIEKPK